MRKRFFSLIIFLGIALDMTVKYLAEVYLSEPIPIFSDYIILKLAYNSGIAFSLPVKGVILQILTLILIFGIIVHYSNSEKRKKSLLLDTGYALLLSGALSHAYERIFIGHVVDFVAVKYFAVFNIADIFITIGILFIIIYYVREPKLK